MNISNIPDVLNLINDESFVSDHFNRKNYTTTTNESYKIIGYNKPLLKVDTYGLIRSMIINSSKVVCFSPSKALPYDQFIKKYSELNENIIAEEFVEGTMINVFWAGNKWEFATRNTVGAEVFFYKTAPIQKTFRTMFLETAKENNVDIELLDKTLCYSFILQHPGNRIVIPFSSPQLYLIAVYEIIYTNDSTNSIFIHQKKRELNQTTLIKTPVEYKFTSYDDLIQKYANMNTSYKIMGVMIHNSNTGERCKLRNPSYEQVRNLKGNHPNLQYQYLSLRQNGKLSSFLHYYPEHSKDFNYFKDNLHLFTNALYQNYISCYIKKEKPLLEYPEEYRTNMFNLHQKYLNELKLVNSYISKSVVIDYVNNMPIGLQMYLLNYNVSKRYLDFYKINFPALKN